MSRPLGSTDAESTPLVVLRLDIEGIVITLFGMSNDNTAAASRRPDAIRLNGCDVTPAQLAWAEANRVVVTETAQGVARFTLPVEGSPRDGAMIVGFDGTYGWVVRWACTEGAGDMGGGMSLCNALRWARSLRDGSEAHLAAL